MSNKNEHVPEWVQIKRENDPAPPPKPPPTTVPVPGTGTGPKINGTRRMTPEERRRYRGG